MGKLNIQNWTFKLAKLLFARSKAHIKMLCIIYTRLWKWFYSSRVYAEHGARERMRNLTGRGIFAIVSQEGQDDGKMGRGGDGGGRWREGEVGDR